MNIRPFRNIHPKIASSVYIDESAVVIGDDVIIGANSLVPNNKVLEAGHLYFGNPVKKIRPLTDKDKKHVQLNADLYVGWKNEFMRENLKNT